MLDKIIFVAAIGWLPILISAIAILIIIDTLT
jgi:hypothetical protein